MWLTFSGMILSSVKRAGALNPPESNAPACKISVPWSGPRLLPVLAAARVLPRGAELLVGDAEQLGERLGRLGRQVPVGPQVRLDDVGRGLVREVDDGRVVRALLG